MATPLTGEGDPEKTQAATSLRHLSVVAGERARGEYDRIVRKLRAAGYLEVNEEVGEDFKTLCPVHENAGRHAPSLHVTKKEDGGAFVMCFGSCSRSDVYWGVMHEDAVLPKCRAEKISAGGDGGWMISSFELDNPQMYYKWCSQESSDRGPWESAVFVYRGVDGREVAAKVKWSSKDFTWLRRSSGQWMRGLKDTRVPLYRVDEVVDSGAERVVYAVEGEKDADRLWEDGLVATSTKYIWKSGDSPGAAVAGRVVVVIPDNDERGNADAMRFAAMVSRAGAAQVRLMPALGGEDAPEGYDVSDWLDSGGTIEELERMASDDDAVQLIEVSRAAESGEDSDDGPPQENGGDNDHDQRVQDDEDFQDDVERLAVAGVKRKLADRRRDEIIRKLESAKGRRLDIATLLSADRPTAGVGCLVDASGALTDQGVFFDGMYNAVFGPPGYGKSWIGILCLAQELLRGNHGVFFTYELPGVEVIDRLKVNCGVPDEVMIERLHLYDDKSVLGEDALAEVMEVSGGVAPTFVLIDSIREALSKGSGQYSDTEISKLIMDEMSAPFTKKGACVVSIDHTGHSNEERQGGSNAKGAVVQGAMYRILRGASVPFARGRRGYTAFKLVKNNVGRLPWAKDGDEASFFLRADGGDVNGEGMSFSLGESSLRLSVGELAARVAAGAGGALSEHESAVFEYFAELGVGVIVPSKRQLAQIMAQRTGNGSESTWKRRVTEMLSRGALTELAEGDGIMVTVSDEVDEGSQDAAAGA